MRSHLSISSQVTGAFQLAFQVCAPTSPSAVSRFSDWNCLHTFSDSGPNWPSTPIFHPRFFICCCHVRTPGQLERADRPKYGWQADGIAGALPPEGGGLGVGPAGGAPVAGIPALTQAITLEPGQLVE
jgi:hypothetical protein